MSVATDGRRDDAALEEGLGRFFSAHPELVPGSATSGSEQPGDVARSGGAPVIRSLSHAEGGLANETVFVDPRSGTPGRGGAAPTGHPDLSRLRPCATGARADRRRGRRDPAPLPGRDRRRHFLGRLALPRDAASSTATLPVGHRCSIPTSSMRERPPSAPCTTSSWTRWRQCTPWAGRGRVSARCYRGPSSGRLR